MSNKTKLLPTKSVGDHFIQSSLNGYLKWDAVYFISISLYGYEYEQMLAFFPLYPMLIAILQRVLAFITFDAFCDLTLSMIAAVIINVSAFTLASIFLYKLTNLFCNDIKFADVTVVLFCLNPANVFYTVFYSESLYACLQFMGMYFIAGSSQNSSNYTISGLLFAAGSAARSNGVVSVGFIGYAFLTKIISLAKRSNGKSMMCEKLMELTLSFAQLLISIISILLPFVYFQYFGYVVYCFVETKARDKHHWCQKQVPASYSYIQNFYWNVGPFKYFEWKQIPNFALALPVIYLSYAVTWSVFKLAAEDPRNYFKNVLEEREMSEKRWAALSSP